MDELPYTVSGEIRVIDEQGAVVAVAPNAETAERIAFCLNAPTLLLRRAAKLHEHTLPRAITEQIANDIKHGVL